MNAPPSHETAAEQLQRDPEVKSRLRDFLKTDNFTNFLYLGRAYLVIGLVFFLAVIFFENREQWGLAFGWVIPVYLLAVIVIGASQHQLAGAAHEAVHHTLFKNRRLNELAGDYLCAFPLLTSVYQFRLYHLAHHQFVNDPERDPDFALLKDSGHWLQFPIEAKIFIRMMLRQILLFELIKYIVVRARYNTVGTHSQSPYRANDKNDLRLPTRGSLFLFALVIVNTMLAQKWGEPWMLLLVPTGAWILYSTMLFFLPDKAFETAKIRPVFHPRFIFMGQTACFTFTVSVLAYLQETTGFMALRYFSSLWYGAILTAFPFFLILRQVIQHGNGDRSWLANTRVFRMSAPVRYAIFPFGMDYHLPHHMYATIPHYRLRAFHDFLMTRESYRNSCRIVDNYFVPDPGSPRNPTVVEVLGPEYAAVSDEVYIDDSVIEAPRSLLDPSSLKAQVPSTSGCLSSPAAD